MKKYSNYSNIMYQSFSGENIFPSSFFIGNKFCNNKHKFEVFNNNFRKENIGKIMSHDFENNNELSYAFKYNIFID